MITDDRSHTVTGAVKVVVYPSGRWADWIVAASSGVSTDPTWAAHLRASIQQHRSIEHAMARVDQTEARNVLENSRAH